MESLIDVVAALQALFANDFALALALFGLTATLIACCVPGTLIPLSVSSTMLLGGWQGALVVIGGAVLGSFVLFVASRHMFRDRVHARFGDRLARYEEHFASRGFLYVVGLRIAGVPHFLVTAGCALSPIKARAFVAATLLGFLPCIALTSAAGSLF